VTLCSLAVLATTAAFAQTRPAFEVATIKPAPPMDMAKVAAAGVDIPGGAPGGAGATGNVPVAPDPGWGGASLTDAVQSLA
jgi:hypothetical protein